MMFRNRLVILLALCLFFPGVVAAAYQDLLDTPSDLGSLAAKKLLNGVAVAGTRLVAVGQRGHILVSDDQGKTWVQVTVPVSSDLVAVNFPTADNGWAVGHDGIVLHSADGGTSWIKQFDGRAAARRMLDYYRENPPPSLADDQARQEFLAEIQLYLDEGPDKPFLDVWFENATTGYIVGAFNLVFRTQDGGRSWEPWFDRIDNPSRLHLYGIRPVGSDLFIVGEQGSLFRLDRQTERFTAMPIPYPGTLFGITGKAGALIAFGMRGTAFRSSDGGDNWQKIDTGITAGLTGATLAADGRIVLVSQAGQVLLSSDDGASFTSLNIERPVPASAVTMVDNNTLVLVGQSGVKLQPLK